MPTMTNEEKSNLMRERAKRRARKYLKEIVELAKRNGVSYDTFRHRVGQLKWDIMRAATTPILTYRECGLLSKEKKEKYI